ncbi:hypothetical protein [Paenibacillus hexagrammi]|uniref:Spore coat protein D n=1 Tax=Paenibacillus hexagrammi TaxID=2908839 RepID=A0ABY3SLI3_9BACL|nr:hypothetical protein [Paenibacillus sp. YPD9-1]UJF34260.1 hypothetical protein L0M14_03270 [Paenibacillus sp. YPD9-1]
MAYQGVIGNQGKVECPPTDPIMTSPQRVVRDHYHPQVVQVVHPIEIVNRHFCVPVYQHVYTCSERDEFCGMDPRFRR